MVKQKKFLKEKFNLAKKLKWNGENEVIKIIEELFNNKNFDVTKIKMKIFLPTKKKLKDIKIFFKKQKLFDLVKLSQEKNLKLMI